ncbi:hypothetical protein V2I01_12210 [Micromonospora sp. BRA006-A]|nr:hypothetical protein [Micromonospora sp. BRA006-A]
MQRRDVGHDVPQAPGTWLRLIDRHDIEISPAPNFAYDLCTRRITDEQIAGVDLSRWKRAVNGSEPVQAATLAAFGSRFAAAGLRPDAMCPGYGLAEITLSVSGATIGRPPVVLTVDAEELERNIVTPVGAGHPEPVRELVSSGESTRSSTSGSSTPPPGCRNRPTGSARSGCAAPAWRGATGPTRRRPGRCSATSWPTARAASCVPGTWACCATASST